MGFFEKGQKQIKENEGRDLQEFNSNTKFGSLGSKIWIQEIQKFAPELILNSLYSLSYLMDNLLYIPGVDLGQEKLIYELAEELWDSKEHQTATFIILKTKRQFKP